METDIVYTIPGNPIALARGRYHNRRVFDSQKIEKIVCGIQIRNQHNNRPLYTGPLLLDITFFLPIAKTNVRKTSILLNSYHVFKPDLSNLIKFVEDIATSVLYHDDCSIAQIYAKKIYGDPHTEFIIKKLS